MTIATVPVGMYGHLRASSSRVAELDDAARIEFINRDHWIGYPRAREGVARLERLYNSPKKVRMPCTLVVGETNAGKSTLLEYFVRSHAAEAKADAEQIPIVYMRMPGTATVSAFLARLLKVLGAPHATRAGARVMEQIAIDVMQQCGTRILIIDEFHRILPGAPRAKHEFLNIVRGFGDELRIPIVAAGTFDAYLALRSDPQLENRFEPFTLPRWEVNEESQTLLRTFCEILPLRRPSHIDSEAMTGYLLDRSNGNLGELKGLLGKAAEVAIGSGEECINQKVLAETSYEGPPQRREAVARFAL